jgi:hypothetical protein
VGLERGPLILVSTIEELLERKTSGSGLENRDYGRRGSVADYAKLLYSQNLARISPTGGGHLRSQATEFDSFVLFFILVINSYNCWLQLNWSHVLS